MACFLAEKAAVITYSDTELEFKTGSQVAVVVLGHICYAGVLLSGLIHRQSVCKLC